jgi:hypothetical protein
MGNFGVNILIGSIIFAAIGIVAAIIFSLIAKS